jgi:predicted Zn-dependent protease
MNSTDADVVITFASPKHRLFEDHHFTSDSLAHTDFPKNGDIHMNDNINWSLSLKYEPNTINMFYVIAHEIGHSLGLNHISGVNSMIYPA